VASSGEVVDGPLPGRQGTGRLRALLVAVLLVVVGLVGAGLLGATALVAELLVTGEVGADPVYALASVVLTMAGYAALGLWYARRYLGGLPAAVPSARTLGLTALATVVALTLSIGLNLLLAAAGVQGAPSSAFVLFESTPAFLLALALVALLANGPAEEILFRGAVQGRLRRAFGPAAAIGVASLLFAAIHIVAVVGALGAALVSAGIILVVAVVLGVVYEYTNNIVVPSLVHGFYNATLITLAYLALTAA
jgi:hypothetical protein